MINNIISFSIKNKLIISLFTFGLIIFGLWSMSKVPIDAVPDVTNNQVQVITVAPKLGTQDVEQFVTYPVELAMANLPGVIEIRSVSRFGLSLVTIVFEDEMGTYLPRQLVNEKLTAVREEIPQGMGDIEMGPISTGLGEIYQYTLDVAPGYKNKYSVTELRSIQDWIIRRQMAMVPGVVEVNAFGGSVKQYEVVVHPHQLKAIGITIADVQKALEANNQNTGGAYIVKDHFANFIRGEGIVRSIEDIEDIVVSVQGGIPIFVKNVAEVKIGKAIRYGAFTKNGEGEAVGGTVMMLKDANSNTTIEAVKNRVTEIQKSLPEGVSIVPFLDRSELIESTTSTVSTNLVEGGLIVIFVLVLLLGNWRGGLIVASTIPLSLLFAFILMYVFDVWANLMSLGAIDFGIIVDGAVIIVESTVFMLYSKFSKVKNPTQEERDEVTLSASKKMMNSAFFGQLIILIVFIPILSLEGVEGKMFKPMALTFMFAMIGAMILALTYVPMMSAWFLRNKKTRISYFGDKLISKTEEAYAKPLEKALKNPKPIIIGSILLLFMAIFGYSRMGGEFIPQLDEGNIAFHIMLRPGSSLEESIETSTKAEKILISQFPEIKQIMSRFGVSDVPTDPMPMDVADSFIILKPKSEWVSAKTKDELVEKMKSAISILPGISYEFSQPIEMRFNELLTGVREDIAVKIFGDDLDILAQKALEVTGLLNGMDGIGDIKAEATMGLPQITIKYQRHKLGQYNLNISDLNNLIQTAFAGSKAGVVFEGERRIDIVLRLHEVNRTNINDIKNLFVTLPSGTQIPLKEVADISYTPGPMQISRDNTNRRTYVGINVRGKDVESLVKDIQEKLDAELILPPGYFIRYGGAFENLQRATNKLKVVVPIALALIFILIYLALRSLPQTLMIYMAIPLAAVGGVFSLWIRDLPFSISAGVGFIVLFGVAVLNGLVLISGLNELKEDGVMDITERIKQGTKRRIRPILLTALTDVLGFLPMAISSTAGAEVQRPLATVVIGGLLTSTLLTLFIIPILYQWIEKRSFKLKPVYATPVLVVLLSLAGISAKAQNTTNVVSTLNQAVAIGLEQNGYVLMAKDQISLSSSNKKMAFNPDKLDVGFQYGQMNSQEQDMFLSINQRFAFPTVYSRQSTWAKSKIAESKAQLKVTENELKMSIRQSWFKLAYLHEKYKILQFQDSLYSRMLTAQTLKYEAEATGYLELSTAQTMVMELENDLMLLEADMDIERNQLRILLNDTLGFDFSPQALNVYEIEFDEDTIFTENNPYLNYIQTKVFTAEAEQKVQSAKALPDLSVGFFTQSMQGIPLENGNIAGSEFGFNGFQAGITVPLFFGAYTADIKSAKIKTNMAKTEANYYQLQVEGQLKKQLQEWDKYRESLKYYSQNALPQAELIIKNAELAYENDAIEYYVFFLNMNQALTLKLNYLETLNGHNQTLLKLAYLLGK